MYHRKSSLRYVLSSTVPLQIYVPSLLSTPFYPSPPLSHIASLCTTCLSLSFYLSRILSLALAMSFPVCLSVSLALPTSVSASLELPSSLSIPYPSPVSLSLSRTTSLQLVLSPSPPLFLSLPLSIPFSHYLLFHLSTFLAMPLSVSLSLLHTPSPLTQYRALPTKRALSLLPLLAFPWSTTLITGAARASAASKVDTATTAEAVGELSTGNLRRDL